MGKYTAQSFWYDLTHPAESAQKVWGAVKPYLPHIIIGATIVGLVFIGLKIRKARKLGVPLRAAKLNFKPKMRFKRGGY